MLAKVKSCAVFGLDGFVVDVEVDISPGLPRFDVVGLPDTAVQEARARVRAAIRNSGYEFPLRRITANLAPADVRKAGSTYDLPLAVALLQSSGQIPPVAEDSIFIGQLSLNGDLLHTDGVLPMAALARESGASRIFIPMTDGQEAALVEGVEALPVDNLASLIRHLSGEHCLKRVTWDGTATDSHRTNNAFDISTIRGQETVETSAGSRGLWKSQPAYERASGIRKDPTGQNAAYDTAFAHP